MDRTEGRPADGSRVTAVFNTPRSTLSTRSLSLEGYVILYFAGSTVIMINGANDTSMLRINSDFHK